MKPIRFLQFALALACVGFIVLRSHPDRIADALSHVDLRLVMLAVLLNLPVALLAPLRSAFVFRRLGYDVPGRLLISTTVLGSIVGSLTPAAAGELLRAGPLRPWVPLEGTLLVVIYERLFSFYLLLLSTVVIFAVGVLAPLWWLPVAAAGALLCVLPLLAGRLLPGRLPDLTRAGEGLLARLFHQGAGAMLRLCLLFGDFGLFLRWSGVTVAIFGLLALQYWLLAGATADGISLDEAWLAFGVAAVATIVTLVPFGLGVLDGSLAALLDRLGMTLEQGAVVAILVRAAITLPLVAVAFGCYLYLLSTRSRQVTARPEPPAL